MQTTKHGFLQKQFNKNQKISNFCMKDTIIIRMSENTKIKKFLIFVVCADITRKKIEQRFTTLIVVKNIDTTKIR